MSVCACLHLWSVRMLTCVPCSNPSFQCLGVSGDPDFPGAETGGRGPCSPLPAVPGTRKAATEKPYLPPKRVRWGSTGRCSV